VQINNFGIQHHHIVSTITCTHGSFVELCISDLGVMWMPNVTIKEQFILYPRVSLRTHTFILNQVDILLMDCFPQVRTSLLYFLCL
jgi:hypothetical protein